MREVFSLLTKEWAKICKRGAVVTQEKKRRNSAMPQKETWYELVCQNLKRKKKLFALGKIVFDGTRLESNWLCR